MYRKACVECFNDDGGSGDEKRRHVKMFVT